MKLKIGIIGCGSVGLTLAKALSKTGNLEFIVARSDNSYSRCTSISPCPKNIFRSVQEIEELMINKLKVDDLSDTELNTFALPDIFVLTVQDSATELLAKQISDLFKEKLAGKIIIHTSGILPREILSECEKYGAITFAAHPYQTFFLKEAEILKDVCWGIDATGENEKLNYFIELLGGKPIYLDFKNEQQKALYHLSAVAASNFITSVMALASDVANLAGIDATKFFPPIVHQTIKNNLTSISEDKTPPLTGPVSRGDVVSVENHLLSLEKFKELQKSYAYFSMATTIEAKKSKFLTDNKFNDMKTLLENFI